MTVMKTTMKAMVYRGANSINVEDRAIPTIADATDAIIRITKTTIWGCKRKPQKFPRTYFSNLSA